MAMGMAGCSGLISSLSDGGFTSTSQSKRLGILSAMAHQMSGDELDRFLSAGTRTGKLATVRADGSPHVAPIWFILDGEDLVFMTGAETVKGRAMLRDPRVALSVDDERPPFAFAIIEGTVSISRDLGEMLPLSVAIARRYMGDEDAEQYGRRNAVDGELLLRLRRGRVTAVADIAD
jgi:PPOX class probable F420-dependent enzyme